MRFSILEYFTGLRFGGAAARFRSCSRRRYQESINVLNNSFVDDLNSKVDRRIKQYRIQIEKEASS